MALVLTIMGVIATVASIVTSAMWGWKLWLQISDMMYGGPVDTYGAAFSLGSLGWNGFMVSVLLGLVLPRIKPALMWLVEMFCRAAGIPLSPVIEQSVDMAADVATSLAKGKGGNLGKVAAKATQNVTAAAMEDISGGRVPDAHDITQAIQKTLAEFGITSPLAGVVLTQADGVVHSLEPSKVITTGPAGADLPPGSKTLLPMPTPGAVGANVAK